jgi:chromosome segregation ATPase
MPKSRKRKMPKTNTNILNMEQNLNLNQFIHLSVNSKTSRCETNRNSEVAQLKSISYELEVGHRQAQAEIQRMKEEIYNLKYENKRLKAKHDNKIEEILNLLTSKDKKIEDLKEKYQKTDSEKCQLKTELRREKNHVNELINENKEFSEIYSKLKERLYVTEEEKRSLVLQAENSASVLRKAADKIKVLVYQNDLSSSELNKAKNSYNILKTEMKSKNVQIIGSFVDFRH